MGAVAQPDTPKNRRPRDRRIQIAEHAGELFSERGFHSVRMGDIAEASGITARALYRHYDNKQALLSHVVVEDQNRFVEAFTKLAARSDGSRDLDDTLTTLTEVALRSRRISLLWQRESRHLDPVAYQLVRDRTRWIEEQIEQLLVSPQRPDLSRTAAELRSWAVFSILTSTAYYDVALPRPRMVRELADASKRVIAAPTPNASPGHEKHAIHRSPSARREQLIAGAAKAFRHSGYVGVSIDDIGGDAGVAGPALYRYFDTKADVLVAAVTRFYEWQALETTRALSTAPEPEQVIAALIEGYVRLAFTATDLLAVTLTERLYLPEDARERLDRIHADNTAEWQRWLLVARPDLRPPQAAVRVNVVKRIIDDCVRTPHLHKNPQFGEDLIQVALATLDLPEQAPAI
ncbi:TetR/AcrR family transcriptional regulator [Streptomyces sp. NPDC090499]|uniref:TetR/AcrR family transcriptional regulator n=1 Tax=unclassified Streptomyces TaxID=2593676 RepID=UPI0038297410